MRTVHFYGSLAERYGDHLDLEVASVQELVRAMQANFGDFYANVRDGAYQIVRGKSRNSGDFILEDRLEFNLGGEDLHIIPVVMGAGKKGFFSIVLGIALIATGFGGAFAASSFSAAGATSAGLATPAFGGAFGSFLTYGRIASFGSSLLLQGVASLLAPKVETTVPTTTDKLSSFSFSGVTNTVSQGGPVPVCYGRMLLGSVVISGGLTIEQLSAGDVPVTVAPTSTATNDDIRLNRDGDPIDVNSVDPAIYDSVGGR